jgi:CheY-like chemotaxis protein
MTKVYYSIFVAEDDEDYRELMEEIFSEKYPEIQATYFRDGNELIESLRNVLKLPDLILLDLIMPRKTGFEVLAFLKEEELFSNIPVIVYSGSKTRDFVSRAYTLGASSFIAKPSTYDDFLDTTDTLIGVIREFRRKKKF